MAEIRKHQPTIRNQIDAAIAAALGEDVRPVPPGRQPARPAPTQQPLNPVRVPVDLPTNWLPLDPAAVAKPLGRPAPGPADDEAAEDVDEAD